MNVVEQTSMKSEVPFFEIGDTVDVHTKILEGEKERTQIFTGTVIARSGSGSREMFTVRRIVAGEGVERKFPVHSPRIGEIVVKRSSVVRRAKLYFLRDRVGKAVRLKDGRVRALASRFLPGRPLGPFRYEGVRSDDPNDVIPHQNRRELRGGRLLAAWLNHHDAREQEPPGRG